MRALQLIEDRKLEIADIAAAAAAGPWRSDCCHQGGRTQSH